MTSTNMAGKPNRKDSRSNISRFSAKILAGFAITSLAAAAAVSPLSAQPMLAEEPDSALVREANISYDQLIDDLGEWGRAAVAKTAIPSYDQLMDDLGEWGR